MKSRVNDVTGEVTFEVSNETHSWEVTPVSVDDAHALLGYPIDGNDMLYQWYVATKVPELATDSKIGLSYDPDTQYGLIIVDHEMARTENTYENLSHLFNTMLLNPEADPLFAKS